MIPEMLFTVIFFGIPIVLFIWLLLVIKRDYKDKQERKQRQKIVKPRIKGSRY